MSSNTISLCFVSGQNDLDVTLFDRYGQVILPKDKYAKTIVTTNADDTLDLMYSNKIMEQIPERNKFQSKLIIYVYDVNSFSDEVLGKPMIETSQSNFMFDNPKEILDQMLHEDTDTYKILLSNDFNYSTEDLKLFNYQVVELGETITRPEGKTIHRYTISKETFESGRKSPKLQLTMNYSELSKTINQNLSLTGYNGLQPNTVKPQVKSLRLVSSYEGIFTNFPRVKNLQFDHFLGFDRQTKKKLKNVNLTINDPFNEDSSVGNKHNRPARQVLNFYCGTLTVSNISVAKFENNFVFRVLDFIKINKKVTLPGVSLGDKRFSGLTLVLNKL